MRRMQSAHQVLMERTDLDSTSWVEHHHGWAQEMFAQTDADRMLRDLLWASRDRLEPATACPVRGTRSWCWFGRGFAGESHYADPVEVPAFVSVPWLLALRAWVSIEAGCDFDACLFNFYPDGMAWCDNHADNEKNIDSTIATLSLGASRVITFQGLRNVERKSFPLESGDLFIVGGETQKRWLHSIPAEPEITEPRLSLTFRRCLDPM